MKVLVNSKNYFKEKADMQRAINEALSILLFRIQQYEVSGVPFDRIFNDDKVKYDKHGDFYTFKCKTSHNHQLRILYSYFYVNGEAVLLVVDYYTKQKPTKEYISLFDKYNKEIPQTFCGGAKSITLKLAS